MSVNDSSGDLKPHSFNQEDAKYIAGLVAGVALMVSGIYLFHSWLLARSAWNTSPSESGEGAISRHDDGTAARQDHDFLHEE